MTEFKKYDRAKLTVEVLVKSEPDRDGEYYVEVADRPGEYTLFAKPEWLSPILPEPDPFQLTAAEDKDWHEQNRKHLEASREATLAHHKRCWKEAKALMEETFQISEDQPFSSDEVLEVAEFLAGFHDRPAF